MPPYQNEKLSVAIIKEKGTVGKGWTWEKWLGYDYPMAIAQYVQAWRRVRGYTTKDLADKSGLTIERLEAVETGDLDPPVFLLENLASGLQIPPAWLHYDPKSIQLLTTDSDEDMTDIPIYDSSDPVIQQILQGKKHEQDLYILLTALLQHGDTKLCRAAEVNLRSLLRQTHHSTHPWESRPPGHFEPPND